LFLAVFVRVALSQIQAHQTSHHADGAGSILHMHDDMWVRGAIFTAVCVRLVVAPPMSRGTVKTLALHLFRDAAPSLRAKGVMSPLRPIKSALLSRAVFKNLVAGHHHSRSITS